MWEKFIIILMSLFIILALTGLIQVIFKDKNKEITVKAWKLYLAIIVIAFFIIKQSMT
jgi:hypothetical protein